MLKEALLARGGGVIDDTTLQGENSTAGWFPFVGDVIDPSTGKISQALNWVLYAGGMRVWRAHDLEEDRMIKHLVL